MLMTANFSPYKAIRRAQETHNLSTFASKETGHVEFSIINMFSFYVPRLGYPTTVVLTSITPRIPSMKTESRDF